MVEVEVVLNNKNTLTPNACYYLVQNCLSSRLLSTAVKIKTLNSVILSTVWV